MALTLRSVEIAGPAVLTSAAPLESSDAAAVVAFGGSLTAPSSWCPTLSLDLPSVTCWKVVPRQHSVCAELLPRIVGSLSS
jgi:hypothetical protein